MYTFQQEDAGSRREMFIGPWRVDTSDLPLLTPGRAPPKARSPRSRSHQYPGGSGSVSPLVDTSNLSRSDPEGISARPPATPVSNFKKRRHRFLENVCYFQLFRPSCETLVLEQCGKYLLKLNACILLCFLGT